MLRLPLPALTYANVMSTLGVFIALGGVSWAAVTLPANSVGSAQLKAGAVTGSKIKNGSIGSADLAKGVLRAGPAGPIGATGAAGPAGPAGSNATLEGVAAGGALAGSFPNPSLANGSVGSAAIADGSVAAADLAHGALSGVVPGGPRISRTFKLATGESTAIVVDAVAAVKGILTIRCQESSGFATMDWSWKNAAGAGNAQDVTLTSAEIGGALDQTSARVAHNGALGAGTPVSAAPNLSRTVRFDILGKSGGMAAIEGLRVVNDGGLLACRGAVSIQLDDAPLGSVG